METTAPNSFAVESLGLSPNTVVCPNEPMSRHTTLRVGGPADLFIEPASEEDLSKVLRLCEASRIDPVLVGRGSNLLVRDGGIRGIVVAFTQPPFTSLTLEGTRITCGAGVRLKTLAVEAKRAGIAGLEFLEGIPGSVGGALRMNAGAMGSETFNVLKRLRYMDRSGGIHEQEVTAIPSQYRGCPLLVDHIALRAEFEGRAGTTEEIARRMDSFARKRWDTQPAAPSAGCMFKNPDEIPAGKLVQELGLKGTRIGGAMVSDVHGNFIVTNGKATARDVLNLIDHVKKCARQERGIELQSEVQVVGED